MSSVSSLLLCAVLIPMPFIQTFAREGRKGRESGDGTKFGKLLLESHNNCQKTKGKGSILGFARFLTFLYFMLMLPALKIRQPSQNPISFT